MAKPITKKTALAQSKDAGRSSQAVEILQQFQEGEPTEPAAAQNTAPSPSSPVPSAPVSRLSTEANDNAGRKPGPPKGYRSPRQLDPVPVSEWFGDEATKISVKVNEGLERQLRYVAERHGASFVDTVNLALFYLFREDEQRQLELFTEFRNERFEQRRGGRA